MEIDESGAFNSEKAKQQAEIRAKLAAGLFCCWPIALSSPPCGSALQAAAAHSTVQGL